MVEQFTSMMRKNILLPTVRNALLSWTNSSGTTDKTVKNTKIIAVTISLLFDGLVFG